MSDIFYSEVDKNLQTELNYRASTGRINRTTRDLNFMLEKIANVSLTPYTDNERTQTIDTAKLGGMIVRNGEYLPSGLNGFLTDRQYDVRTDEIVDGKIQQGVVDPRINSSRRTPPFITSCDISIGDNSNGLLNSATINIVIPNPERDLNFIESVYFRPGRACTVIIEHPKSAIVSNDETDGKLTEKTLPSIAKIYELYPNISDINELQSKYGKMNSVTFDGIITSFTFDYQTDMSVTATISLTGTSNIYTDISLIVNSDTTNATQTSNKLKLKLLGIEPNQFKNKTTLTSPNASNPFTNKTANLALPISENPNINITGFESFYAKLDEEIQNVIDFTEGRKPRIPNEKLGYTAEYNGISEIKQTDQYAIWGSPFPGADFVRYITLSWLIDFINRFIITKAKKVAPDATVICTALNDLCVSNYYEHLVSADPYRIYTPNAEYGELKWFNDVLNKGDVIVPEWIGTDAADQAILRPTAIMINMEVIQEIAKRLNDDDSFTVSSFLAAISMEIYVATGHAIDLKLITHPQDPKFLLFYDANKIKFKDKPVPPYSVPMFANNKFGTVVRDFKFSAKLPSDASSLAYVVNQDPGEIAESDIAPYVAYMYTANTITRTGPHEVISNGIAQEDLDKITKTYLDTHRKFLKQYKEALKHFGRMPSNTIDQITLHDAVQKYVQYPTPTIQEANQLTAPVIPFDVEFTIDGINGFRYGDVLTFEALPSRYKRNAVFTIVSVTHTVGTDGVWTTTIRCIMRPAID
jgi:hypothetical protein